ncbi:MAG: lipoprotein [Candidatus Thorarchaeota archaeon]
MRRSISTFFLIVALSSCNPSLRRDYP